MAPKEEQEGLEEWMATLWGMWEEAITLGYRKISLKSTRDAFEAGFLAGRNSFEIIPKARKAKKK